MSSASAIPPSHAPSPSLQYQQHRHHQHQHQPEERNTMPSSSSDEQEDQQRQTDVEWPALTTDDHHRPPTEDWELLQSTETDGSTTATGALAAAVATTAVRIVEPAPDQLYSSIQNNNSISLKHCQSSPDLRKYVLEENNDDDNSSSSSSSSSSVGSSSSSSGVLIQSDDITSLASSSVVVVPSAVGTTDSPSKPSSPWTSKVSFKDTLLKKNMQQDGDGNEEIHDSKPKHRHHHRHHHHHHNSSRRTERKWKQANFVVVQPTMKRNAKSTGDLRSLVDFNSDDDDDVVLGDTDAQLYYNQKAQGELGRKNGRKQRPDEAKRLQITMAKKSMQRARNS